MEQDPVITRAYPGTLWEKVPLVYKEWESTLREWLASHIDPQVAPWNLLRWLTEAPAGVALSLSLALLALLVFWRRNHPNGIHGLTRRNVLVFLRRTVLVLAATIAADAVSLALKRAIGRLKPRVDRFAMVDPWPAFSLPSSHAFNSAFIFFLVRGLLPPELRVRWRWPLRLAFVWLSLVGVSRVLFGEHYPSDVLAGWIFGGALGHALAWLPSAVSYGSNVHPKT